MRAKERSKIMTAVLAMAVAAGVMLFPSAKVTAAEKFDPAFYAAAYPDVSAAVGTDANALYIHYVSCGRLEGRMPYAGAGGGELVDGIAGVNVTAAADLPGVVPLRNLPHYNDLRDSMTDAEFVEIYNNMAPWMQAAQGMGREEQVIFVCSILMNAMNDEDIVYTNATPHYSNAYGLFYYGGADSSGCTRAAGLMYEMLGIEWEHAVAAYGDMIIYHWSVVTIDGKRYIVDPCMGIITAEETRYVHPAVDQIFKLYGIK